MNTKRLLSVLTSLFTLCAIAMPAHSQLSHSGTHFLFSAFPSLDARKVAASSPPRADIYIVSESNATASVQFPATDPVFTRDVSLAGGEFTLIQLPTESSYDWQPGINTDRSIKITSDEPVEVFFSNPQLANSDATQIPPTESLGERYFLATYNSDTTGFSSVDPYGGFSVTSPYDNNSVTIVPTQTLSGEHLQGQAFEIILNKGESFVGTASDENQTDLTGTVIASDKPVQVTSGNLCANVPEGASACDTIFTNNLPVESWGTHYVLSPLSNRNISLHRAIAAQPNTDIYVNGAYQGTLNTGEHLDLSHEGGTEVTSNNPIGIVKFITGGSLANDSSGSTGDPAITYITPVKQYKNQYSFALVDFVLDDASEEGYIQFPSQYLNISTPASAIGNFELNSTPVDASEFSLTSSGSYATGSIALDSDPILPSSSELQDAVQQLESAIETLLATPDMPTETLRDGAQGLKDSLAAMEAPIPNSILSAFQAAIDDLDNLTVTEFALRVESDVFIPLRNFWLDHEGVITRPAHVIESTSPFSVEIMGYGPYDSYLYAGGLLGKINPYGDNNAPDCSLEETTNGFHVTASDDISTEDANGNNILDPGEDTNNNGILDRNSGLYSIEVVEGVNASLTGTLDVGALEASFTLAPTDSEAPMSGTVVVHDGAGNACQEPFSHDPKPPHIETAWFTGGGKLSDSGQQIAFNLKLHCDASGNNTFKFRETPFRGKGGKFTLENMTDAHCYADSEHAPEGEADTFEGSGTGQWNGQTVTVDWTIRDFGEPASNDAFSATLRSVDSGEVVFETSSPTFQGNIQAHH